MSEEKRQVFISYSRRDLAFVEQLAADLQAAGLDVWYDLSGLEIGDRWQKEITKAIRESQYLIVVLSAQSVSSEWVEPEYLLANKLGLKVIPLYYKRCELPLYFLNRHYIDVRGKKYKQKFNEILETLDIPAPYPKPVEEYGTPISGVVQKIRDVFGLLKKSGKSRLLALIPAILLIVLGVILYSQIFTHPFLFFCGSINNAHICEYTKKKDEIKTVPVLGDAINWAPVRSLFGSTYFTSDRDGKAEIYRLKSNGEVERVTQTSGSSKSWSPAVHYNGILYFTSNRAGKAEIYRLNRNGNVERVTNTPGRYESWSPAVGFDNDIFFTSDRAGKAEIYRLKGNGDVERVTNTPAGYVSWAPAYMLGGDIYFTSNRDGKSEIYRLIRNGSVERVTNTPGVNGSWSPIVQGRNVYFTSSRSGQTKVYLLKSQVISILSFEGWTNISERIPLY